jgi:phosphatidylglycerophosphate synthase
MLDEWFRVQKERLLAPVARWLGGFLSPIVLTLLALLVGIGAAAAASRSAWRVALTAWLLNRLMDGVDGVMARQTNRQTELGGYLDIVCDFIVYAAMPLGMALAIDLRAAWLASTVLLASWFVNAASWMYLAAVLEKRGAGATARGELTSVTMPRGLVAGAETVVFVALFLLLPSFYVPLAWIMTAGVAIGIAQRVWWARHHIGHIAR